MLPRMPLTEEIITSRYRITGYREDSIIVNDTSYRQSLILSATSLHCPWSVRSLPDLDSDSLEPVFSLGPEVVILGTGQRQRFPGTEIMALFARNRLGLEVMDTGALCRTFNILVAEGRNVVAAAILGD